MAKLIFSPFQEAFGHGLEGASACLDEIMEEGWSKVATGYRLVEWGKFQGQHIRTGFLVMQKIGEYVTLPPFLQMVFICKLVKFT